MFEPLSVLSNQLEDAIEDRSLDRSERLILVCIEGGLGVRMIETKVQGVVQNELAFVANVDYLL